MLILILAGFGVLGALVPARWGWRLTLLMLLPAIGLMLLPVHIGTEARAATVLMALMTSLQLAVFFGAGSGLRALWEVWRKGGVVAASTDAWALRLLNGGFLALFGAALGVLAFGLLSMVAPQLGAPVLVHVLLGGAALLLAALVFVVLRGWKRVLGLAMVVSLTGLIAESALSSPERVLAAAQRLAGDMPRCLLLGDGRVPQDRAELMGLTVPKTGGLSALLLVVERPQGAQLYRWSFSGLAFFAMWRMPEGLCVPHLGPLIGAK